LDEPPEGEDDPIGLLEIKSANAKFMPVKEVSEDYLVQINTYMHCAGRKWAKLIYIDPMSEFKDYSEPGKTLPTQEMVIKYDPAYWDKAVAKIEAAEEALAAVQELIKRGNDPQKVLAEIAGLGDWRFPKKICPKKTCARAKRCGVRTQCFDDVVMERILIRLREGRDPVTGVSLSGGESGAIES
jgi:hypothetical protein